VARALARSGKVRPAVIIHSGKLRARETAELLAEALAPVALEQADGLMPKRTRRSGPTVSPSGPT
jgi:phosphohistidine phosphatase SixA